MLWFKTGLKFTSDEIGKLLELNLSMPKIAKEYGNENFNKYILASINSIDTEYNYQKNIRNQIKIS